MDLPDLPALPPGYAFHIDSKHYPATLEVDLKINKTVPRWWGGTREHHVVSGRVKIPLNQSTTDARIQREIEDLIRKVKMRFDSMTAHERYIAEIDEAFKSKYNQGHGTR